MTTIFPSGGIMARRHKKHRFGKDQWFINRKRRERASMTVALRWKIKNDVDGQGIFTSHQYIPGSPSWNKDGGATENACIMHWADIVFCSRRPTRDGIFYNATIQTVADDVVHEIEDEAYNAVMEMMSESDRQQYHARSRDVDDMFEKLPCGNYRLKERAPQYWSSLDGLTIEQAQARWIRQYMTSQLRQRPVTASYTKNFAYRWGVGLEMVVDAVSLSTDALASAVIDFWQGGEQDKTWSVDIRKHLPAIEAKLMHKILIQECKKGQKIVWEEHLNDEQLRHVGYTAVSLKGF